MKYQVGDLILIKNINLRRHPRILLRRRLVRRPHPDPELNNTHGIITEAIKHNDAWEDESEECDNFYVWYSQSDGNEYWFCEDELDGEVIK